MGFDMCAPIKDRNRRILNAAVLLSREDSYQWITRADVARASGVSGGTISGAFGTMADLKRAVIREAISSRILPIIAEALGARHPIAIEECPADLKREAMAFAAS